MKTLPAIRYPLALVLATMLVVWLFNQLNNLTTASFAHVYSDAKPLDLFKPLPPSLPPLEDYVVPEMPHMVQPPRIDDRIIHIIDIPITTPVHHKVITGPLPKVARTEIASGMVSGSDHELVPLVRIPPVYPPRAQALQLEGWVQVRFNVSSSGGVTDASVVASEPSGVFDQAAVNAISHWRYQPRVDSSTAVETRGLQTIMRFELPNN